MHSRHSHHHQSQSHVGGRPQPVGGPQAVRPASIVFPALQGNVVGRGRGRGGGRGRGLGRGRGVGRGQPLGRSSYFPERASIGLPHHHGEEDTDMAAKFVRAFRPIQYMLTLTGQFPMYKKYNKDDGTYTYRCRWYRPETFLYIVTLVAQACLVVVMAYNSFTMFRQQPQLWDSRKRSAKIVNQTALYDIVLVTRYRHTFITIWVNLLSAFASQIVILKRVRHLEEYFSYWTRTAQRHHYDVGAGIWKFSVAIMGGYAFYLAFFGLLYVVDFSASFRGIPTLMAVMMFKMVEPDMLIFDDRTQYEIYVRSPQDRHLLGYYQHIGAATFVLLLVWSKSNVLIFLFKCKLLSKAFTLYNQRVYSSVIKGRSSHSKRGKLSVQVLFKDHCCMLDLLEATDHLFANIFEIFIGLHVAGLLHELYFLFLNISRQDSTVQYEKSFDDHYHPRPHDYVLSAMMVFQYVFFLGYTSRIAAMVGEQAMDGLEVLRRSSMIGRENDADLFFHFSMYQSYSGRAEGCLLKCGGFFTINKGLMTGIFGTFLGYYIILQQFHPTFESVPEGPADRSAYLQYREQVGKFLFRLEHLAYCHWTRGIDEPCPFET